MDRFAYTRKFVNMDDTNEKENLKYNFKESDGTFTNDEAVELTGHGRYNYLLLAACSLASFAAAVDILGFSVAVAAAKCDLNLDITLAGVLDAAPLAGIIFAFAWGYIADTKGRRKALLTASSVSFVFAVLASFAPNWQSMFTLKFVGGSFTIALNTLCMTYLGENTSGVNRRRYIYIVNSINLAAEIFFYLMAYFILRLDINIPISWLGITFRSWRVYTLILSLPLLSCALLLLTLYESPKLLVSIGKTDEAMEILKKMFEMNGGKKGEYTVKAVTLNDDEEVTKASIKDFFTQQVIPLFMPPMLWRTLQLFYLMILCGSTNNIFLLWYPMIVNLFVTSFNNSTVSIKEQSFCERIVSDTVEPGTVEQPVCNDTLSTYTIFAGMALGLTFAAVNLAASAFASHRRVILMTVYFISGLSMILVNVVHEPVTNLIAFTLIQGTAIGFGSVASYFVDLYPTSQRGLASSLGFMAMRLTGLAGVNIVGPAMMHYCPHTFYTCAVIIASGIVTAIFLPSDKVLYK